MKELKISLRKYRKTNDLSQKTTVTEQIRATWYVNDYLFDHGGDTIMAGGEDREKTMKQNITC